MYLFIYLYVFPNNLACFGLEYYIQMHFIAFFFACTKLCNPVLEKY